MLRRSLRKIEEQKARRANRNRAKITGTEARPRVSVFRSLKHLSVQVVNDNTAKTLAAMSDKLVKDSANVAGAKKIGLALAENLKNLKITQVVFDKGRYAYHGRVKAVAEGLREGGINF